MNTNTDIILWADAAGTHPTVAAAIFALAGGNATVAQAIWADPTETQRALVIDYVATDIRRGDCDRDPHNRYCWGCDSITVDDDDVDASAR